MAATVSDVAQTDALRLASPTRLALAHRLAERPDAAASAHWVPAD